MYTMAPVALYPLAFLAAAIPAAIYIFVHKPGIIVRWFLNWLMYRSGLRVKYITANNYEHCYAERGKPQKDKSSVVFIHGFSASKEMWMPVIRVKTIMTKLPKDLHIIIADLPGHGHTFMPSDDHDISIEGFITHMHELMEAVGLKEKPFHLVGISMGGMLGLMYAVHYPDDLERLTVICPSVVTEELTEFWKEIREGKCRLLPQDPESLLYMINSCQHKKISIPKPVLKGFYQLREPRNPFFHRLFKVLMETEKEQDKYMERIPHITMPTQVVWGEHDEIIHVSGADMLQELLPNCQRKDIIERCGHSVHMDRPWVLVKRLLEFRGECLPKPK